MDLSLDRTGRRQRGLLTTSQLLRAGWSSMMIHDAVKANDLIVVRRRVFRVAGAPFDHETAVLAAVLGAGENAFLCGLSTGELFDFRWFPPAGRIHLLSEGPNRPRMPGVVGHRTLSLPAYDLTHLRSIPTTTPERAFIDVCGTVSGATLGDAGDDLLRRNIIRLPRLMKSFELIPQSGRRKRRPMYGFFAERVKGYDPGGSERELDVMKLIKSAGSGLVLPKQQYRVRVEGHTYFLDYSWPETLNALEWEGWWWHGKFVSDFHKDKDRTRRLQRAGWTIWPVTARTSANEILAIAAVASGQKLVPQTSFCPKAMEAARKGVVDDPLVETRDHAGQLLVVGVGGVGDGAPQAHDP